MMTPSDPLCSQALNYAKKWRLKDISFECDTENSSLYSCRLNGSKRAVFKILKPQGLLTEKDGFELLAGYGPKLAVQIFEFDQNAAVMELLEGPRLLDLIDDGKSEQALDIQLDLSNLNLLIFS